MMHWLEIKCLQAGRTLGRKKALRVLWWYRTKGYLPPDVSLASYAIDWSGSCIRLWTPYTWLLLHLKKGNRHGSSYRTHAPA